MSTCIFHCQPVKDKQQNSQKHIFKSINACPPKGAAISVYPSGVGSGLRTCSRRLACSSIFKFTFSCSQASGSAVQVFFRYHSFTLYILSTRHPIAASSTRAAIVSVSTILSPSYSCNKNGIDCSTPFQQRTGKNCRLQQRPTRSAPCLFLRTGRRLDQVAVRILILIYDDIRCSIRSRSCYGQFF